jgi:hypothetical protein
LPLDPFTFLFKLGAIFAKRVVHRKQELNFVLDLSVIRWPPEFFSLDQVHVQISYISFLVDKDVLEQRLTELFFRQRLTIFLNVNFVENVKYLIQFIMHLTLIGHRWSVTFMLWLLVDFDWFALVVLLVQLTK